MHPSGIEDEGELAYVSMDFWVHPDNANLSRNESGTWSEPGVWERLLAFQQGWKACSDYHKKMKNIDEQHSRRIT